MKAITLFLLCVLSVTTTVKAQEESIHKFAPLPYAYDALEPYIDKLTMEIHYDRHHRAYFTNFTAAIKGTDLTRTPMEDIFSRISSFSPAIKNNAGGYWNHTFFWNCMKPNGGGAPTGKLNDAIIKTYGSFEEFKKQFAEAATKRFGSGWAWLAVDANGKLFINSTANQDNPLMNSEEKRGTPIFCLDVWEHAYYLKYQNKRADYVNAFWNVANWGFVQAQYEKALEAISLKK